MTSTIGAMRSIVKFEKNQPIPDEVGGEIEHYVEVLTTRGYLRSRTGNRSLTGGDLAIYSSHELTCRLSVSLETQLTKDLRVLIDNRFFTVADWQKEDEKRFFYKFQLNEQK